MTLLRLPRIDAPLNAVVAYTFDLNPLLVDHRGFFAGAHPDGERFADVLASSTTGVLERSATADRERAEAKIATEAQTEAIAKARAHIQNVRKRGRFISDELKLLGDEDSLAKAGEVRIACAIGSRVSVSSLSGLRRLLDAQISGVEQIADILTTFKQPDLKARLVEARDTLTAAIAKQSKEQMEADVAEDRLDLAVEKALQAARRAVRLVAMMGEEAPIRLRTGLRTLEGQHRDVFYPSSRTAADEDEDDEVDAVVDDLEPVEPA